VELYRGQHVEIILVTHSSVIADVLDLSDKTDARPVERYALTELRTQRSQCRHPKLQLESQKEEIVGDR
jgi:hypothetical protein